MTYDNITTQYNVARRVGEIYHLYLLASGDHIDVCLEAALKKTRYHSLEFRVKKI